MSKQASAEINGLVLGGADEKAQKKGQRCKGVGSKSPTTHALAMADRPARDAAASDRRQGHRRASEFCDGVAWVVGVDPSQFRWMGRARRL